MRWPSRIAVPGRAMISLLRVVHPHFVRDPADHPALPRRHAAAEVADGLPGLQGALRAAVLLQSLSVLDDICLAVGIFSLPACISFAISKYHLYDIDRLISRTLSYTVVTGLLVGIYAGLVLLATEVFRFHTPVAVATPTRPSPRSRPGRKTRWTWARSAVIWPMACTRPWNPPTYRCGSATATEAGFHRLRRQPSRSGSARHHGSRCAQIGTRSIQRPPDVTTQAPGAGAGEAPKIVEEEPHRL